VLLGSLTRRVGRAFPVWASAIRFSRPVAGGEVAACTASRRTPARRGERRSSGGTLLRYGILLTGETSVLGGVRQSGRNWLCAIENVSGTSALRAVRHSAPSCRGHHGDLTGALREVGAPSGRRCRLVRGRMPRLCRPRVPPPAQTLPLQSRYTFIVCLWAAVISVVLFRGECSCALLGRICGISSVNQTQAPHSAPSDQRTSRFTKSRPKLLRPARQDDPCARYVPSRRLAAVASYFTMFVRRRSRQGVWLVRVRSASRPTATAIGSGVLRLAGLGLGFCGGIRQILLGAWVRWSFFVCRH